MVSGGRLMCCVGCVGEIHVGARVALHVAFEVPPSDTGGFYESSGRSDW